MKKLLFLIISIFMLYPSNVFADSGPKPTVKITVEGIHETAYMTLLSKESSSGPFGIYDGNEENKMDMKEYGPENVWQSFVDYEDSDGFYFLQYFQPCAKSFQWTYHPPEKFKILIYFPESDTFIVSSQSYERYAFNSYYTVSLSTDASQGVHMNVSENYIWNEAMFGLAFRMLLTIIVEVIVALMMHIGTKRELLIIVGANLLTQIILNLLLEMSGVYAFGYYGAFFYILFEVLIVMIEINIYKKTFHIDNVSIKGYTIVANILSFIIGFMV